VCSFGAAVEPLLLEDHVHLGRVRNADLLRLGPFRRKPRGVPAAALEAWAVAGRERRHLIEKEQRGVAVAPDLVVAVVERQDAADPLP
jgi:hypothetical protein